jgi:hypothetical protein
MSSWSEEGRVMPAYVAGYATLGEVTPDEAKELSVMTGTGAELRPLREIEGIAIGPYRECAPHFYPNNLRLLRPERSEIQNIVKTDTYSLQDFVTTLRRPEGLFIAAHARSLELTLVTNNTGEFGRVQDLNMENWAE